MARVDVTIRARVPHFNKIRFALAVLLVSWAAALILSAMPRLEVD